MTGGIGDREAVIELGESVGLRLELLREPGQVLEETDDLVDQRRQRQVQELDDRDHRDHVDEKDRQAPAHPACDEPADRRVEQIHHEQAEHERPNRVPRHP